MNLAIYVVEMALILALALTSDILTKATPSRLMLNNEIRVECWPQGLNFCFPSIACNNLSDVKMFTTD